MIPLAALLVQALLLPCLRRSSCCPAAGCSSFLSTCSLPLWWLRWTICFPGVTPPPARKPNIRHQRINCTNEIIYTISPKVSSMISFMSLLMVQPCNCELYTCDPVCHLLFLLHCSVSRLQQFGSLTACSCCHHFPITSVLTYLPWQESNVSCHYFLDYLN